MKLIFLVESGKYGKDGRDFMKAFFDEQKAWEFVLKKYKKYHLRRENFEKKKGLEVYLLLKKDGFV